MVGLSQANGVLMIIILQEEKKGSPIDFTGTTGTTSTPATTAQPNATAVNPEKPTL